jgi:hypothetical protein
MAAGTEQLWPLLTIAADHSRAAGIRACLPPQMWTIPCHPLVLTCTILLCVLTGFKLLCCHRRASWQHRRKSLYWRSGIS